MGIPLLGSVSARQAGLVGGSCCFQKNGCRWCGHVGEILVIFDDWDGNGSGLVGFTARSLTTHRKGTFLWRDGWVISGKLCGCVEWESYAVV